MPPNYFQQTPYYHIFISHSWDYGDDRNNLASMIVNQLGINNVVDYAATQNDPIHSQNDAELAQAIANRVAQARVFVIPAGMYVGQSKWIPIEIQVARQLQKPIIGVETWGSERVSTIVRDNAHELVGWNGNSIAQAIRRWHG